MNDKINITFTNIVTFLVSRISFGIANNEFISTYQSWYFFQRCSLVNNYLYFVVFILVMFFFNVLVILFIDLGLVHTMPDKFENATLRAKTEQMFCVHTRGF